MVSVLEYAFHSLNLLCWKDTFRSVSFIINIRSEKNRGDLGEGMSLYQQDKKQTKPEQEVSRELQAPKRFESREQWEQWKRSKFKTEAEFRAWQNRDRKDDLPHLKLSIPQSALDIVHEKGRAAADGVAQRDPDVMRYIKDPQLQHFLHSYGRELGHHAINPAFRDKPGAQAVWGATNFALNEKFRPRVNAIALANGVDLSDLNQAQVVSQIGDIAERIKNNPSNRIAGGRLSRENRQAISVLTNFRRRYEQGLKTQARKAKELWQLAEIPAEQRPGYIETASKNNIDGVAVSFRREMQDTDGDGSSGYEEYIARTRARSGAGLARDTQKLVVTTLDSDFRGPATRSTPLPLVPERPAPPRSTKKQTAVIARPGESNVEEFGSRAVGESFYHMPKAEFKYWKGQLDKGFKLPFSTEQAVSFLSARSASGVDTKSVAGGEISRLEHARRGYALLTLEYQQNFASAKEDGDKQGSERAEQAIASLKPLGLSLGLSLDRSRSSEVAGVQSLSSKVERRSQTPEELRRRPSRGFASSIGMRAELDQAVSSVGAKHAQGNTTRQVELEQVKKERGDFLEERADRWFASFNHSTFANDPQAARRALENFLNQGKVSPDDLLSMSNSMRKKSDPSAQRFADLLKSVSGLS
jgi:hypothetical protein